MSIAGTVRDASYPLGWRNARAEAAEARVQELENALWFACEGEEDPSVAYDNCLSGSKKQIEQASDPEGGAK